MRFCSVVALLPRSHRAVFKIELLADDLLDANHYDVVCTGDGVTSISEALKDMPDLMILDLALPAGDGFSVLERMKTNEKLASIPVIVLPGSPA
jgi:two-component system OmpR family response regulator